MIPVGRPFSPIDGALLRNQGIYALVVVTENYLDPLAPGRKPNSFYLFHLPAGDTTLGMPNFKSWLQ